MPLHYIADNEEPPAAPGGLDPQATHTAEIPYVFNNLAPPRVFPDASSPGLASASARDQAPAGMVSSYWVNFARKVDPNGGGLPPWPAFRDRNTSRPMMIGDSRETPDPARLALYDALYANLVAVK